jgi:YcxB-like protein
MKLRYENTMDDLVAFNRYHCSRSPTLRRLIRSQQVFVAMLFVAVPLGFLIGTFVLWEDPVAAIVILGTASILAAAWFSWYPSYYRRCLDRNAKRLYAEGTNHGVVGLHDLELGNDMLIERNDSGESRIRYAKIEKLETSSDHLFIYVTSMSAHIVPLDDSTEGDPMLFRDALQLRMESARETGIQRLSERSRLPT